MKGVVEILAAEVGVTFDPSMERPEVLYAYMRQLLGHFERHVSVLDRLLRQPVNSAVSRFLERIYQLCDGHQSREDAIQEADIISDLITEADDDDGWPRDKSLEWLKGACCAIRFGLETPCHSRWPAEAGGHLFKMVYGFRLYDSNTGRWQKEWLRDRFNDGLRALANAENPSDAARDGCGSPSSGA